MLQIPVVDSSGGIVKPQTWMPSKLLVQSGLRLHYEFEVVLNSFIGRRGWLWRACLSGGTDAKNEGGRQPRLGTLTKKKMAATLRDS
jgi:hypothetical protein